MTRQQTKNWLLKKINEDFFDVTEQQLSEGKFSPTLDYLSWLCEEYKKAKCSHNRLKFSIGEGKTQTTF